MTYDLNNTYWCSNGAEQSKYDEMEAAGFEYLKGTEAVFYRYYRFFNDGDCPAHLRWSMRTQTSICLRNPDYIAHCKKLEAQVTERILKEYTRFQRNQQKTA